MRSADSHGYRICGPTDNYARLQHPLFGTTACPAGEQISLIRTVQSDHLSAALPVPIGGYTPVDVWMAGGIASAAMRGARA